jgi:HSP20 family molecular chaperone IbpA
MDIDVKTKTVSLPGVRIVMKEEEIQFLVIEVDMAGEDKEELSIAAEAEISVTA